MLFEKRPPYICQLAKNKETSFHTKEFVHNNTTISKLTQFSHTFLNIHDVTIHLTLQTTLLYTPAFALGWESLQG